MRNLTLQKGKIIEKPLVFIVFSWFTTFAKKYETWDKKDTKMGPKIDEKSILGCFLKILGCLLGYLIFDEFSIGKKWTRNQKNEGQCGPKGKVFIGPAECAGVPGGN